MTRVELYILLAGVLVSLAGAYRPYCPCYAEPGYQCPPAPQGCELTTDECGCCNVCAGLEGESCGTGLPSCASGLTCVLDDCTPQLVDVTLADGTVTQQLSQPPCLFLPYFRRGTCRRDTGVKRQAIPIEGSSCEVDGVTIQNGEFVHVTPCKPCSCYNGQPICTHVDCFWSHTCAQWEYPADQCCPVCKQEITQEISLPLPVVSKRQAVPGAGASCEVSGVTIQEGQFVDVTPCEHCGCYNGQPICAVVDCFWQPSCTQWAYPADQCCPVCVQEAGPVTVDLPVASKRQAPGATCEVDGVTIAEGEWKPTDEYGCTTCGCTGGQPLCWSMACALDANCAEWERVPGQCCPVCTAYHHTILPVVSKRTSPTPATCEVQGVTIADGEWKPIDQYGCTTCGCSNGQSFCQAIGCAFPANCAETEQIPGQCCPVCTSFATCEVNGVVIQEGETKPTDEYGCETCSCVNGQPICQAIACALPANCAETDRIPGQCCPVCTSYTTCEEDGVTIQEGETVDITPCKQCTCVNGQSNCAVIACDFPANCAQFQHLPGQCCPSCVSFACQVNGVTIQEGEWHQTDEYGCETCTCSGGQTLCQATACAPLLGCLETERVPGQCCPVCKTYQDPVVVDPIITRDDSRRCELLTVPMCEGLGYNSTRLPNAFGQLSQADAGLEMHQFYPLVAIECSPFIRSFLCALYAPPCKDDVMPPCREMCESSYNGCVGLMAQFGFSWPEHLKCTQFPSYYEDKNCTGWTTALP